MANRIQIRRGTTEPTTDNLLNYELGYNRSLKVLYINNNSTIQQVVQANSWGQLLTSGENVDTLLPGVYYSSGSTVSATLNGTKPNGNNSGFRLEVIQGYGTRYGAQIAYDSTGGIKIRKNSNNGENDFTGIPWSILLHSNNYSSYALPLSGGTMNDGKAITFQTTHKKDGGSGWAYAPIKVVGNDSALFFNIGVYGNANTLGYAYIGSNDYDSTENFRIYSAGSIQFNGGTSVNNLIVQKAGDTYVRVTNTSLETSIYLDCGGGANHGVWSSGYYNGSSYTSSGKWLIYRNSSGDTVLNPCTVTGELISSASAAQVSAQSTTTTIKATLDSAASGNHGVYSWGYWDGSAAHTESTDRKWMVYRNTSGDVILNGNAVSASSINIVDTTPTSNTTYYLNFTISSGSNYSIRANSLVKAWIAANGDSAYLTLGDASHAGGISLYSGAGKYLNLVTSSMSNTNKTIIFPDKSGTVALTTDVTAVAYGGTGGTTISAAKTNLRIGQNLGTIANGGTLTVANIADYSLFLALNSTGYVWYGVKSGSTIYFAGIYADSDHLWKVYATVTISGTTLTASSTLTQKDSGIQSDNHPAIGTIYGIA